MIALSISLANTEPPMVRGPHGDSSSDSTHSCPCLATAGTDCEDVSWNNTIAFLASTVNDPDNSARPWSPTPPSLLSSFSLPSGPSKHAMNSDTSKPQTLRYGPPLSLSPSLSLS
jgi:hypothetical protein